MEFSNKKIAQENLGKLSPTLTNATFSKKMRLALLWQIKSALRAV